MCKARKLGVRKCCAAGHHREGYVRRKYVATKRTLYCLAHGQPACHSCRTQQKGSQHCCALGHHQGHAPRKYRRRANAPPRPIIPGGDDTRARTASSSVICVNCSDEESQEGPHVISDDSDERAHALSRPTRVDTGPAVATSTTSKCTRTSKRLRTEDPPLASSSGQTTSTFPRIRTTPSKRPRAVNTGKVAGADSPRLSRPRAGAVAPSSVPKRRRGVVCPPDAQHNSATPVSDLCPLFRSIRATGTAAVATQHPPLGGERRSCSPTLTQGHQRMYSTPQGDAVINSESTKSFHSSRSTLTATTATQHLPLGGARRGRQLAPP